MDYFNGVLIIFALLFGVIFVVVCVWDFFADRKGRRELEECFAMINRCSMLVRSLGNSSYLTDMDITFLRSMILRNLFRVCCGSYDAAYSKKERGILDDGYHCLVVLNDREEDESEPITIWLKEETDRNAALCPYVMVLEAGVAGLAGICKRGCVRYDKLEWVYYLWLAGSFMRAVYTRSDADRKELERMCCRVEKWSADWGMDSYYLKDKITESRVLLAAG